MDQPESMTVFPFTPVYICGPKSTSSLLRVSVRVAAEIASCVSGTTKPVKDV
jgi:hypothetical protein